MDGQKRVRQWLHNIPNIPSTRHKISDQIRRNVDKINKTSEQALRSSKEWTKWREFDETIGDSSKVYEITIGDEVEDEDGFELIIIEDDIEPKEDNKEDKALNDTYVCCKDSDVTDTQTVVSETHKPTDRYICVFCPEVCESSESAKEHYLSHCGVYLECGECRQKFSSIQSYRRHNSQHLDRNKMWNLDEFMDAKKWCDLYIDYIDKHEELIETYDRSDHMFCSVCRRIKHLYEMNDKVSKKWVKYSKVTFDEELVRNHLHQHLQYFPYECIDCRFDDKKTEFCLNSESRQHLQTVHKIENAFDLKQNELKTYFDRKKSIKKLDKFIDYCLNVTKNMNSFIELLSEKCDKQKIFVSEDYH